MVCHGGLGSMLGAMEAGCPMVVVPLGADQLGNAAKAEHLGIATVLDPAGASVGAVADAISFALRSAVRNRACEAVRREVAEMALLDGVVQDLEAISAHRT
jgi:UDP:flavonoid glycosyltransferase YjiC (YdhE family)